MKTSTATGLRTTLLALTAATTMLCPGSTRAQSFDDSVRLLSPSSGAVTFEQIDFVYENVSLSRSDWGQIVVDPALLRAATGRRGGYVNVFMPAQPDAGIRQPYWSVQNLSVPAMATLPIVRRFDLRPGIEGRSTVIGLVVLAVYSPAPLPNARAILEAAIRVPAQRFRVAQVTVNGEGSATESRAIGRRTLSRVGPVFVLGQPPQPTSPPFEPEFGFHANIGVYQADGPNVEQARNQCVPAAYANVLQYLEDRYRISRNWTLVHDHVPGIGAIIPCSSPVTGRQPIWLPVPTNSLVANLCAQSQRAEVCSCSTGKGTGSTGFFRYLALFGHNAPVEIRHQGGPTFTTSGITSASAGPAPTWSWIRNELQAGNGVYVSYCRYDAEGSRTGGHALRVWGAEIVNGRHYLLAIDDSNQGCNTSGARTRQLEVADIGRPGGGEPNGILNINGLESRELTSARSVRALNNFAPGITLHR